MPEVTISFLGQRGDGVALTSNGTAFVPFSLPGERLDIDDRSERATILALHDRSPDRVEPFCPYFTTCGGCAIQHLGPELYAKFKTGLVEGALRDAGIAVEIAPMLEAHGEGRRRATLHVRKGEAGYMRARSHDLLDIAFCPILVKALEKPAPPIARQIGKIIGDCDVLFTATDTGLDIAVRTEKRTKAERLTLLAQRLDVARFSLNGQLVLESRPPTVRMGKAAVVLPTGSFLQATAAAEQTISDLVLAGVGNAKAVADLFCGVGPFSLRLAETARVFAADSDKAAIAALQLAARHTRGLKPITAQGRDLYRDPLAPTELTPYDAVVFDPPRAGAQRQVEELARSAVKTVVAVSCDPRTFARDAQTLLGGGYKLKTLTPVDQFAWSTHMELVAVFER